MILASDLPERDRKKILQEALVAARLVEDDWRRAYALTELASHLPEKDRKKILREAFREPLPAAWLLGSMENVLGC